MAKVTVAYGDGIGPEIMKATLKIFEAAGVELEYDEIEIGEQVYKQGHTSGIKEEDWEKVVNNKIFFKAPITTPQGGGYKSLNVTIRKTLGLYANIRPVKSLHPFVQTKHPKIDMVIVRENEEDLYAGIEHRQTPEVYQCLKLITAPGSEKICRYAFELAKAYGRDKVTCMTKDNIMKLTDGLFHKTFDKIGEEYSSIKQDHSIIDIGMARVADTPENFDVIVTPNLYGDIVSDVAAQVAGSVGLAGSANIGETCAMFEAIHGSAPDIAGQKIANPSGLLMGGLLMLRHLGMAESAVKIENAWLKTIEDGIHTGDIASDAHTKQKVGTDDFAQAIIDRLGQEPAQLKGARATSSSEPMKLGVQSQKTEVKRDLDGVDIFAFEDDRNPDTLGGKLKAACADLPLDLVIITNRGVKVFPDGKPETFCTDHWRCRFMKRESASTITGSDLIALQTAVNGAGVDIIKTENLYTFDGDRGYSLGQGQ
ncbi:MAG: NADP-dependent isocitrate dehydrogenase [Bdellovibrionales bacterium]|nr:NADP-dependent isocitrate dehydrogenase [Bdellovibrionales bacterium]